MGMQPWELLVLACTATGLLALGARHALRLWGQWQMSQLGRESQALLHWWTVLGELPAFCLDQPTRRSIGRLLFRRLDWARRIHPDHPFLREQRMQIARFIGQPLDPQPVSQSRAARERTIAALQALIGLLRESGDQRLLGPRELVNAEAAVSRRLTELEFVQSQHVSLQADYLRQVTRAIGAGDPPPWVQLGSSSALPTQ